MNIIYQFAILILFIVIGFVGMFAHWIKKRFKDKTICCTFFDYMRNNPSYTVDAFYALIGSEIGFVIAHSTGWEFTIQEISAVFMAGFLSDSGFNQAAESDKT